jgi:hypothetical protein
MAKKISPIIPLAAAGIGVALLLRGSKSKSSTKDALSESERGEILAGLPDSADIIYEDGQVILGQHFVEDNLLPFLGESSWTSGTTGAMAYIGSAMFIDKDDDLGERVRNLVDLKEIDPEAYEELKDAIIAISKVHQEHVKAAKGEDKPMPYGTMAQKIKAIGKGIAQGEDTLTKFMIAQIEKLKAEHAE